MNYFPVNYEGLLVHYGNSSLTKMNSQMYIAASSKLTKQDLGQLSDSFSKLVDIIGMTMTYKS